MELGAPLPWLTHCCFCSTEMGTVDVQAQLREAALRGRQLSWIVICKLGEPLHQSAANRRDSLSPKQNPPPTISAMDATN